VFSTATLWEGSAFTNKIDSEFEAIGLCDKSRENGGSLGQLHSLSGVSRKYSHFPAWLCQQVYSFFRLEDGAVWLDPCCGHGMRQRMAAWFGYGAVGFDVRDDAVLDCQRLAAEAAQSAPLHLQSYHVQDMRTCAQTAGKMAFKDGSKISKFGGLFTSIPFWKMERYQAPGGDKCEGLMEYVKTYHEFLNAMETGFRSAISCLEPGAPVVVHCQEFRDGGKYWTGARSCQHL
jgi:hypothetical protein